MTYVSTYNEVKLANPFLVCNQCGGWIDGYLDMPGVPLYTPCEHRSGYSDVCPSWGPVDGCQCQEFLGYVPHKPRGAA